MNKTDINWDKAEDIMHKTAEDHGLHSSAKYGMAMTVTSTGHYTVKLGDRVLAEGQLDDG